MADDIGMHVNGSDLEKLSRRLKAQADGGAQKRYRKAVLESTRPVESQLRAAARSIRVTSSRGGEVRPERGSRKRRAQEPLRARLAAAVGTRPTRKGLRFYVDAEQVDPQYGASLSRYSDGELQKWRRWRHPVFGDEETWVQQTGSPWFFTTIRKSASRVEQAIEDAMDDVARDVQG